MLPAFCRTASVFNQLVFLLVAATFEFIGGLTPVKEVRKTMIRAMRTLPLLALTLAFPIALLSGAAAMAQNATPTVRIVNRLDESDLAKLKGNTHPFANAKNDRGLVDPTLPMTDLILVLNRGAEQQAAFDKFVASQYDSSSPNFHHWLTPEQVGENYGASETDIATISSWLTGHGFSIQEVTKDHLSIRFSGTAAQVQSTFHTEIHNLEVKGVAHIGNMSDPQIPSALAPVVVGVKALHNFFPRPQHKMGHQVTLSSAGGGWQRANPMAETQNLTAAAKPSANARTAHPDFTINVPANGSSGAAYTEEDVSPYDFATIYNVLPLWNKGIDGTGQTIAIAGTSDISQNDIATFRTFFGLPTNLPANTPQIVHPNPNLPGGDDPGICTSTLTTATCTIDDLVENSLDVEWSGAVAKNAQLILVTAASQSASDDTLYDAESYIVNNVTAHIRKRELWRMRVVQRNFRQRRIQHSVARCGVGRNCRLCCCGRLGFYHLRGRPGCKWPALCGRVWPFGQRPCFYPMEHRGRWHRLQLVPAADAVQWRDMPVHTILGVVQHCPRGSRQCFRQRNGLCARDAME